MTNYFMEYSYLHRAYEVRTVDTDRLVFRGEAEEAECMLEECQYFEKAEADYNVFNNQECEFDYV